MHCLGVQWLGTTLETRGQLLVTPEACVQGQELCVLIAGAPVPVTPHRTSGLFALPGTTPDIMLNV